MEKRARGRPSGGGSKLQRTETVTLRLDPRLRYLTELAARRQRRTVSSFIEWAIEHALSDVILGEDARGLVNVDLAAFLLWDPHEADRFAKLALYYPELLTYDEEVLWKLIWECEVLWHDDFEARRGLPPKEKDARLLYLELRTHWEVLKKVAAGEADTNLLPRRPGAPPIPPILPSPTTRSAPTPVGDHRKP
jgi:uncharacterized protein (DUF1778 family)